MPKLLIMTSDGKVFSASVPLHFMVAEKYNVDLDKVVAVGFETRGREVWDKRKPH